MTLKRILIFGLMGLGTLAILVSLSWSLIQKRACDGPSVDEIYTLQRDNVDAYVRLPKESIRIKSEGKQRLIEIFKKNTTDWTIPWSSENNEVHRLEFSTGSQKILTIGVTSDSISRGWCFKKLSGIDLRQIYDIINRTE